MNYDRVIITDIGKGDGYYSAKKSFIGKIVSVKDVRKSIIDDGFYMGFISFSEDVKGSFFFISFKFKPAVLNLKLI